MPELIETPPPQIPETPPPGGPEPFADMLQEIAAAEAPSVTPQKPAEEIKPSEEAPKPEEDDIDSVKPPESQSKAASEHWEKLKGKAKSYKEKAIAAEAAIAEKEANWAAREKELVQKFEEASSSSGELVELRARKEAFEAAEREFSVYSVERTQEFQNTIVKPLEAIDGMLKAISKSSGIDYNTLADAVSEDDFEKQDKAVEEILPQMSELQKTRFLKAMEDARGLLDRRADILRNAHEAQKELKEKTEREAGAARDAAVKEYKSSVKNTAESLAQRMPFVELADGETKEGIFKSMLEKAEAGDFDKATPATKGTAAFSVVALERAVRQLQKQDELIKSLEARVAEKNNAAPSVDNPTPPAPAPDAPSGDLASQVADFLKLGSSHKVTLPQVL